jgi:hypothetical protein
LETVPRIQYKGMPENRNSSFFSIIDIFALHFLSEQI